MTADAQLHPALVNRAAGVVATVDGQPMAVMGFTVTRGKIVEIHGIADFERVRRIAAAILPDKVPASWQDAGVDGETQAMSTLTRYR